MDSRDAALFAQFCKQANIVPPDPANDAAIRSVVSWFVFWKDGEPGWYGPGLSEDVRVDLELVEG